MAKHSVKRNRAPKYPVGSHWYIKDNVRAQNGTFFSENDPVRINKPAHHGYVEVADVKKKRIDTIPTKKLRKHQK